MQAMIQPVTLRLLTYVLSSLLLALPAWAAGLITVDPGQGVATLSLATACGLIGAAIAGNIGIAARWGVRVDPAQVSGLLLRLAAYGAAPALAALPSSWAGLVSYDPTSATISLSYGALPGMAAMALAGGGAVFARWGAR